MKTTARITALLILLLPILVGAQHAHAALRTVTGTVTKISDGDTIRVITPEQTKLKIRLYGIDAAEMPGTDTQRYAPDARKASAFGVLAKLPLLEKAELSPSPWPSRKCANSFWSISPTGLSGSSTDTSAR